MSQNNESLLCELIDILKIVIYRVILILGMGVFLVTVLPLG